MFYVIINAGKVHIQGIRFYIVGAGPGEGYLVFNRSEPLLTRWRQLDPLGLSTGQPHCSAAGVGVPRHDACVWELDT